MLVALVVAVACGDDREGLDASAANAGPDSASLDASAADSGARDASAADAGAPDARLPDDQDAGVVITDCAPSTNPDTPKTHAVELSIEQGEQALPSTSLVAGAYFPTFSGGEVLRIVLIANDDPAPQISDDESSIILILDLDADVALAASGETFAIDETVLIDDQGDSTTLFADATVHVTDATNSALVRHVIVAKSCFCDGFGAVRYRIHGDIALEHVEAQRFRGALALDFSGDLTSTPGQTELHFEGCFDVEEDPNLGD